MEQGGLGLYISKENLSLELVIPKDCGYDFVHEFEEIFTTEDHAKSIDAYKDIPDGWSVKITVEKKEEQKLMEFINKFCSDKNILFLSTK